MPTVSIIIPAYNAAKTIRLTIDSILNQTVTDTEIIVVDDGSRDDTARVVNAIRGRTLLISTEHRGAAAARNAGAKLSGSEYLFFCDADIILAPAILEKMLNVFRRKPGLSFVYCAFDWGGRIFGKQAFDKQALRETNFISTMSLIRRSHFPGFDETLERFQDWDLWLTMVEKGRIGACIPEVLFSVLPGYSSMSGKGYWSRISAIRRIRLKHHLLPMRMQDYLLAVKEGLRAIWTVLSSS